MSLVLELQQLAWEGKTDISDLLKKAFAVAFKLNLRGFKSWADCELNGYAGKKMPPYRKAEGRLVCWNPYNGWIPIFLRNPSDQSSLSSRWVDVPVGVLQEHLAGNKEATSHVMFPPKVANMIMRLIEDPFEPAVEISRSAYVRILDAVRNTILKWSLKLEADGILGEGLTFSADERKAAIDKEAELRPSISLNVSIANAAVGAMKDSVIQQASPAGEIYFDPDAPADAEITDADQIG